MDTGGITFYFSAVTADLVSGVQSVVESVRSVGESTSSVSELSASFQEVGTSASETAGMVDELSSSLSSVSEATGPIEEVSTSISNLDESLSKSSGGFLSGVKNMVGGVLDFGSKIGQTAFGVQMFANTAEQLGSALLGPAMQMEQMTTAFTTLDGSASAATDEIMRLNTFAAKTPFQTSDIDHAAASLQAFGIKATDVIPDLTGIGDALSSMGKTSGADLDQITLAFGHIQTEGHLSGRTLMELGQLGINGMAMLEKATGKSKDELQKMISNGTLPAKDAIADLVTGIEKSNLGGGMAKQAQTAAGQLSTLKSNANLALAALAGPALKLAEGGLSQLGNLLSSPQFQQFATSTGKDIATAFTDIGNVIGPVASGIGSIINWFIQGSAPAQVVGVALLMIAGGFAAIQIGAFVAAIPALVGGFIAWAVAAWTAAAGTIAATWPLFLIGAAVVLVVAIIILAVRNWGAISKWLQQTWAAVIGWLGGALNSIGEFFVMIWNKIKQATNTAWEFLKNIVKAGATFLLAIILGPFLAIGALFVWLYAHNIYFKQLIDTITGIVTAGLAWLQDAFHAALQWIIDKIMWFVNINEQEFNLIYSTIRAVLTAVYGFVRGIVTTIINFFSSQWNEAVNLVTQLWQKISSIFQSAWSRFVQSPLGQLLSNIVAFFQKLPGMALTWGENLIKGFINGILNMLGGVGDAVSKVAGKIAGFLGFRSPTKEGPGRELNAWPRNMVREFAEGMEAGIPLIEAAVTHLIQPTTALASYPGGSNTPNAPLQGNGSGQQQVTHVHVYLDSQEIASSSGNHQAKMVRLHQARRTAR